MKDHRDKICVVAMMGLLSFSFAVLTQDVIVNK